jgi:hypothetical protein
LASQWGNNSLAPGSSAGWYFVRPNLTGFLPVLQVTPLSSSFTSGLWSLTGGGYPYWNQLGISTAWSQLTNDLSELVYFLVVQNNSNNVIEYAFLEADSYAAANVPAPVGGLVSNSNYYLEDGGNPLTGVTATVNFTVDFVSSANGYSFQLNCYSTEGTNITTEWQQYVIYASPNDTQLWARIDTWSGTALSDELNRIDVPLANLPSTTIEAGYALTMALTYTNDGTGTVTGATYSVTDENGNLLGNPVTIGIVGKTLRTTGQPATAANLAPIAAFQYDIGGDYGGAQATLTSGAGTIVYTATNNLSVVNAEPSYTDFDDGTAENANLIFGPLANDANQVISQSWVVTTGGGQPQARRRTRRSHGLPPPDNLSREGHVLPPPDNLSREGRVLPPAAGRTRR